MRYTGAVASERQLYPVRNGDRSIFLCSVTAVERALHNPRRRHIMRLFLIIMRAYAEYLHFGGVTA